MEFKPTQFPPKVVDSAIPIPVLPKGFKMPLRKTKQVEWMATLTDKRKVNRSKMPMLLDDYGYPDADNPIYSTDLYLNTETHVPEY